MTVRLMARRPFLAPGTAPSIRRTPVAGLLSSTLRLRTVTRALPMWPAILKPFSTRPGVVPQAPRLEELRAEALSHLVLGDVANAELPQVAEQAQLLQVPLLRRVEPLGLAEAQLHRLIAVGLQRLP